MLVLLWDTESLQLLQDSLVKRLSTLVGERPLSLPSIVSSREEVSLGPFLEKWINIRTKGWCHRMKRVLLIRGDDWESHTASSWSIWGREWIMGDPHCGSYLKKTCKKKEQDVWSFSDFLIGLISVKIITSFKNNYYWYAIS